MSKLKCKYFMNAVFLDIRNAICYTYENNPDSKDRAISMKLHKAKKHDDQSDTYEYVVAQKIVGKFRTRRVLFRLGFVFLTLLWFAFGALTHFWPLLCLIPLSLWVYYYFVHPYTVPEYKYEIAAGILTASVIYGGRLEGILFSRPLRDFSDVLPCSAPYLDRIGRRLSGATVFSCASSADAPDLYVALFTDRTGTQCAFYFEATERALKMWKYYNPDTVVVSVSR